MTVDTACSSSLVTTHLAAKVGTGVAFLCLAMASWLHSGVAFGGLLMPPCIVFAVLWCCTLCYATYHCNCDTSLNHVVHPAPCQGLERGECEAAGSVGVNLTLVHSWTRACLRAGMLAEDGRCKTLDASAGEWLAAGREG